jgi:MtN3 and saliva related transmembrane protein
MSWFQIAEIFGFAAAAIGVVTFLPQALTIHKTKITKSISLTTFVLLSIASLSWLVYGMFPIKPPVLIVNTVILFLSLYIVMMKLKHK